MARRISREELLKLTGAAPEALEHFESQRLLVPNVPRWPPWSTREPYYTEGQVEVLRWLMKGWRAGGRTTEHRSEQGNTEGTQG